MVTVPADIPVTLPEASMVAMVLSLLIHTPPPVTSLKAVPEPIHAFVTPVIAATTGSALTVNEVVTEEEQPKVLVTE